MCRRFAWGNGHGLKSDISSPHTIPMYFTVLLPDRPFRCNEFGAVCVELLHTASCEPQCAGVLGVRSVATRQDLGGNLPPGHPRSIGFAARASPQSGRRLSEQHLVKPSLAWLSVYVVMSNSEPMHCYGYDLPSSFPTCNSRAGHPSEPP